MAGNREAGGFVNSAVGFRILSVWMSPMTFITGKREEWRARSQYSAEVVDYMESGP